MSGIDSFEKMERAEGTHKQNQGNQNIRKKKQKKTLNSFACNNYMNVIKDQISHEMPLLPKKFGQESGLYLFPPPNLLRSLFNISEEPIATSIGMIN